MWAVALIGEIRSNETGCVMPQFTVLDRFLGRRAQRSTSPVSRQAPIPMALWAFLPVNALALISAMTLMGSSSGPEVASFVLVTLATVNAALGASIALRLSDYELPLNRRAHVRLFVQFEAQLDASACRVYDLSLGGASVITSTAIADRLVGEQRLEFSVDDELLSFRTEAVRIDRRRGEANVALRYLGGQDAMIARLAIALLSEAEADVALGNPDSANGTARAA
jgi:hypothetical protein